MYQYAIPLAAITFSYLFGGGNRPQQDPVQGRQNQGVFQNLASNWMSGGWGEMRRMMGLEATAEEEEQRRRRKDDEERNKMDEKRKKDEDEDYERKREEDRKRADRRRVNMERDEEHMRREHNEDEYSRRILARPEPRRSHRDESSAASVVSAATLIAQAIDRPPHPQQIRYADSWQEILMKSGPYLRAPGQSFGTHNPALVPSLYPDSGYSSMIMNDPRPIVDGRGNGNGVDYDRAAQGAPGPTTGSGDRSRSGGPGPGPEFFGKDNIGSRGIPVDSSRDSDLRNGQGSGENADYYSGKYQERRGAYEAPDMMGAMGNRLNDDAKRRGRGQDTRSQDEEYGRRSRSGGGPDFDDAYARNVDSRRNGDGNYYRERSRGDYQDGGRRNLRRSPSRRRAGQDYEDYDRRRNHADDHDEERRRGRSRAGGSRYDDDEYGVDGRYRSTSRHRTKREERDAYIRRRRLDPHARDHEDHLSHLDDDRNGAAGGVGAGLLQPGVPGGTTIINNVLGGFPMTAGVVSSSDPAPAGHTSISEPAPEPIQPETVIEEKPTEKVEPVLTEREQQEKDNQARRARWVLANEQRGREGRRRKGYADANSASQKAEVSHGPTQPEELSAETITEDSTPRTEGTGKSVSSSSRGSDDLSLKAADPSDDRDLSRKNEDHAPEMQAAGIPTVSSHTVAGQESPRAENRTRHGSVIDSSLDISPTRNKPSGHHQEDIWQVDSGMDNSSIPPKDFDPEIRNAGYQDDKRNGKQPPSVSPKTSPTNQPDSIPSPASSKDSAISLGYDGRNSQIHRPESALPDKESPITTQAVKVQDGAKREHGLVKTGKQRYSSKAELVAPDAAISPVRMAEKEHPDHEVSTGASLLKEPEGHVGMDHAMTTSTSTTYPRGRKRRWAEERMRETTKHAMQAQSSVLKRHNVTGPRTFGRLIKLALKSSPKMAFLSSVVMVIYLIGAVYLGNQVANILQVTAPSSRLSRRQSPGPSSSATTAAADPETSTFSSSTFESFDEDTQILILINVWHAISWLVLVSLAHYIWENIPDPDGPRTRKNWLDKFGFWSMLRVPVTVAPMSVYLLLGARQLTSCAYLLNDPDAIAWSMGPDVGLTWNYLSENNGRGGSTPATVNAPVQDMGDWQLLLISVFFWLTGIPVLLYSIKRVQYPGSLSRGKIIRKVENRYGPNV
ncbi:hypothetical protein FFLO_03730 [Filobasidium floriforme]|uniref:Uncharacterized protein n=1 Tax=Filobasidium floriforme TaxID=5210 RepID=A0A8K0JKH8_9TREE|nr:hypothetical protein FFLO_03730 [Filobasidium floriforme]